MLRFASSLLGLAALSGVAQAGDPSPGWLNYAAYTASPTEKITMLNATWQVPSDPKVKFGSGAPGWWFGVQTADGNGALIQPILAWADGAPAWTIFNGIFDWNDQSWVTSDSHVVKPNNTITASVWYIDSSNSYGMEVGCVEDGWSVKTYKKIKAPQIEATAYFVLEHAPMTCEAYPTDGEMSFKDIYMEVEGKPRTPQWKSIPETPACDSTCEIVSPSEIKFTWNPKSKQGTKPSTPDLVSYHAGK